MLSMVHYYYRLVKRYDLLIGNPYGNVRLTLQKLFVFFNGYTM